MLRKSLIAAVAGAAAFLLTNVLDQEPGQEWQVVLSVLLGGSTLIVQYLVDFAQRFEEAERRSAELLDATELFSHVDGSVLRSDEVTQLVRGYTKVREQSGGMVQVFAEKELARLSALMKDLESGSADCPGENHEWLIDLTECVKMTVDATSTSVDRDFWHSGPAMRYLAAQEKAVKRRGVEIRRLFVVNEPHEVTDTLRELCEQHRKRGIDARIAVRSLMASNPLVNDFIVFDGELCYEIAPDLQSNPDRTRLHAKPEHIADRINQFNELWSATGPERLTTPRSFPAHLSPAGCHLFLTLVDDHPVSGVPARIQLRVQPGPQHPWSQPGADRPELTAVATPLTPAEIEPVSVSLRPFPSGDGGAAEVLFTPDQAGTHRIRVAVHDRTTGTVLQQAETTVRVSTPGELPSTATPFILRTEGE
ncbi:DUF6879 family protein [Streptomyces sp. HUAS ZL42]|uniref:DUF6879 family protein n=1 Tax=Streptomyces sp. HUAS ZL42 TaxID=3231715 RepID=UPI00345ED7A0